MGKLIIWNVMSLDGAFEGATPWDLSMHETVWGPELEKLSKEQLADASCLLFGRATYAGMAQYWASPEAANEGEVADGMNNAAKAVVSTTLQSADWNNTRLLRSIDDVAELKRDADKRIYVFGSARLTASLREAGLIDEYRVCIAPILLGKTGGAPLFKPENERQRLELVEARPIAGGGVLLFYRPA
jgi:dihydrofolate reductase